MEGVKVEPARVAPCGWLLSGAVLLIAAALLTGCAGGRHSQRVVHRLPPPYAPPPYRPTAAPAKPVRPVPTAYAPAYAGAASNEALLRLRAGLNVAALSCRGGGMPAVTPGYGRLLSRHRTLLASAYQAERQRLGSAGLDRQQARLYNRFAQQRSPQQFCRAAADVASRASSMDSANLRPAAPRLVSELETRLR